MSTFFNMTIIDNPSGPPAGTLIWQRSEVWIQREMGDGSWIDYGLKESPDVAKERIRELRKEKPAVNFRAIIREITDSLLLPDLRVGDWAEVVADFKQGDIVFLNRGEHVTVEEVCNHHRHPYRVGAVWVGDEHLQRIGVKMNDD